MLFNNPKIMQENANKMIENHYISGFNQFLNSHLPRLKHIVRYGHNAILGLLADTLRHLHIITVDSVMGQKIIIMLSNISQF